MEPQNKTTNKTATASEPWTSCGKVDRTDPEQQLLTGVLESWNLQKDPTSIINLGKDGVLRNLSGDREVLDAIGLSPSLITAFLSRLPPDWRHGFEGCDGTKTPKEKWYKPDNPNTMFPPPLSKEKQEEVRKRYAERKAKQELENQTRQELDKKN